MAMGLDPLLPRRYAELVALIDGQPVAAFENLVLYFEDRPSPLWPLLNAPYRLAPPPGGAADGAGRYVLQEYHMALPRAFAVEAVTFVASADDSLAALRDLDPTRQVIVEREVPTATARTDEQTGSPRSGPAVRSVALRAYVPGDVTIDVDLPAGGAVVLLESWHPGWHATIDGTESMVYAADHAFVAALLPPGSHEVRFRFEAVWFRAGILVAFVTGSLVGLAAALPTLRRARMARFQKDRTS
jgi:hypothetical protein